MYKVEISNSPGWRNNRAATLGISAPSENWQNEKFRAILDFVNKRFSFIRVDVTDVLYRHNFIAQGANSEEAYRLSSTLGALWISSHQEMFDACNVPFEIIRWERWLEHPDFTSVLTSFRETYESNALFRNAINKDVLNFYARKGRLPQTKETEKGLDFLLEEVAVLTIQAKELSSTRFYPGEELESIKLVRQSKIASAPTGLEREVFAKIKFVSCKSLHHDFSAAVVS